MRPNIEKSANRHSKEPVFSTDCENRLKDVAEDAPSKLGVFRRAYAGGSRLAAIQAKCLECVSMSTVAIRECRSVTCPLWQVRPYQKIRH